MLTQFVRFNRSLSERLARRFPRFFSAEDYVEDLRAQVLAACSGRPSMDVLEVGGIDRPLLKRNARYTYDGLDIDAKDECYSIYDSFTVQSIEKQLKKKYDLIFSTTVLEHVRNNSATFNSIFEALRPEGLTLHYVPSKRHPYSLCLRLVGPRLQRTLIARLRPWAGLEITGYPTFFDHCSPSAMRKLLTATGFRSVTVRPYYRANDYFAFFVPAFLLVSLFENMCRVAGWDLFCSGMIVSARKPGPTSSRSSEAMM